MSELDGKIVFGVSPGNGDGIPCVLLGIPEGAWEYMRDGKTHNFDLTSVGLPIKLMLYGAKTHADALLMIEAQLAQTGLKMIDERDKDFSIKPKPSDG